MKVSFVNILEVLSITGILVAITGCTQNDDDEGPGAGSDQGQDAGFDGSVPGPDQSGEDDVDPGTPDSESDPIEPEVEPDLPPCGHLSEPCCETDTCEEGLECWDAVCIERSDCPGVPACIEPPSASCGTLPLYVRNGAAPTLGGGSITMGAYKLTQIEFYTDATFSDMVTSATITNNGGTCGAIQFYGPEYGFSADLDLTINVVAMEMEFPQVIQQALYAAGCWTIDGNQLMSDITECSTWVGDADPPDSLEYQSTPPTMKMLLNLTRDTILASVEESMRWAVELAIEGDLPILFSFQAVN